MNSPFWDKTTVRYKEFIQNTYDYYYGIENEYFNNLFKSIFQ